jgi:hypothetical protein
MRKLLSVILVCLFAACFTIGVLVSTAEARPPCIATCINGYYWVCCPTGGPNWECFWDGPCDWGPMP